MWDITLDRELAKLIPEERLLRDEPMYKHTTFRAGGKAQRFISVEDTGQLTGLLDLLKENMRNTQPWAMHVRTERPIMS